MKYKQIQRDSVPEKAYMKSKPAQWKQVCNSSKDFTLQGFSCTPPPIDHGRLKSLLLPSLHHVH